MGNSGSAHNINWDSRVDDGLPTGRSKSELSGYYHRSRNNNVRVNENEVQTQSLLRRQQNQTDRLKKKPLSTATEQFKVLPKIGDERHKLRPTTNGRLLNAGGTISGRNKDDGRLPGQLMQRSRTLIFDQRECNDNVKENFEQPTKPIFQRSQTLLSLSYKERDSTASDSQSKYLPKNIVKTNINSHESPNLRHARSEPNFHNDLNRPTHARQVGALDSRNVPATQAKTTTTKLNKYNKKRKAPPAPALGLASGNTTADSDAKETNMNEEKTQVARRFRSNINIKQQTQRQQQQQQQQQLKQQQQQPQKPSQQCQSQIDKQKMVKSIPEVPVFRREKSCDAILLRSKAEPIKAPLEKRFSYTSTTPVSPSPIQTTTITTVENKSSTTITPKQVSKIPQLKRTFYFGMTADEAKQNSNTKLKVNLDHKDQPKVLNKSTECLRTIERPKEMNQKIDLVPTEDSKAEQFDTLEYKLNMDKVQKVAGAEFVDDDESQINDNGILVHIRPALPRRQLDVPSFSPAAAWRMLINAEEELIKRIAPNTLNCESPIQLRNDNLTNKLNKLQQSCAPKVQPNVLKDQLHTTAWTPQQDLDDDDDDDANNEIDVETSSSDDLNGDKDEEDGLLFFNGRTKKGGNDTTALKGNEQSSLGIHLFSLSLPRDSHMETHMQKKASLNSNSNEKVGFSSLQKLKLSISGGANRCSCRVSISRFATSNGESSTDSEFCEIHTNAAAYRSDNWVLHKTGAKEGASNVLAMSNRKLINEDIKPTVEPISLSYLTGGKHIMYLPGMTTTATATEVGKDDITSTIQQETTTPSTNEPSSKISSRQRQRKKDARESLQDETPILRPPQTQSTTNNSAQRFSFQSTIRILEKRKIAEKLSRDAEIREAQRKSELEAMKRVEEDFQRKRASEKANIRHQLRLYCSGSGIDATHEQYNSLPVYRHQHDNNNNKISGRRAEPDGAAASPSPSRIVGDIETQRFSYPVSHLPLKRMDSDCGDSDIDGQNDDIMHFNRTASMVEPYLQSFMK